MGFRTGFDDCILVNRDRVLFNRRADWCVAMTEPHVIIEQQRETIERQRAYIAILEDTLEGRSREGLHVITQRRFENALMLMTCAAVIALIIMAWRYAGPDIMVFGAVLLVMIIAAAALWFVYGRKR